MPVRSDEDVVRLRKLVREQLISLGFSLVDQTKMVTAASELARNTHVMAAVAKCISPR
jgi:serine/threonine-protein kinase RsbT